MDCIIQTSKKATRASFAIMVDATLGQVAHLLNIDDAVVPSAHDMDVRVMALDLNTEQRRALVTNPGLITAAADFVRDDAVYFIEGFGSALYAHSVGDALRSLAHRGQPQPSGQPWPKDDALAQERLIVVRMLQMYPELDNVTCEGVVYNKERPVPGVLGNLCLRRAYAYAAGRWNPVHFNGTPV